MSTHTQCRKIVFVPYDSVNPYQDELSKCLESEGVNVIKEKDIARLFNSLFIPQYLPDILHLHWLPRVGLRPFNLIRSLIFIFRLLIFRVCGVKLIWTSHNLIPHETKHPMADIIFRRVVGKIAHRVIAHGVTAREELIKRLGLPLSKIHVVPHGNYIGIYGNKINSSLAKKKLGIELSKTVMLYIGNIRPYKGVLELIIAFKNAGFNEEEVSLIIAGKPLNVEFSSKVTSEIGNCSNINYRPGFVPDNLISMYMSAADVVVLPYKNILSSGSALLAMSFGKCCIAPAIGCLNDVLSPEGNILYSNNDLSGLENALIEASHNRKQLEKMGAFNLERAKSWSWQSVAKQTAKVYSYC